MFHSKFIWFIFNIDLFVLKSKTKCLRNINFHLGKESAVSRQAHQTQYTALGNESKVDKISTGGVV